MFDAGWSNEAVVYCTWVGHTTSRSDPPGFCGDLGILAESVGITTEDVVGWALEGKCGMAGERLLTHIRRSEEGPALFSVAFVSIMGVRRGEAKKS